MALLKKKEFCHGNMCLVINSLQKRRFPIFYKGENSFCKIVISYNKFLRIEVGNSISCRVDIISVIEIARKMACEFGLKINISSLNFSSLENFYNDELRDYWIGADDYIYSNEEREKLIDLNIPIYGESASPSIPYQSDKRIHDTITYDSDIYTLGGENYGANLLVKNADDFINSKLKVNDEYFTITLRDMHDSPIDGNEIIKLPEFELSENIRNFNIKIKNKLKNKNIIDLSGFPENIKFSFHIDLQEECVLIDDWKKEFENISKSLNVMENKEQFLPRHMFEEMLKKSYIRNVIVFSEVQKHLFDITSYEMDASNAPIEPPVSIKISSDIHLDAVEHDDFFSLSSSLSWAYKIANTLKIPMPRTTIKPSYMIFKPTIKNFIFLQKSYGRIIDDYTKIVIESEIEKERKSKESIEELEKTMNPDKTKEIFDTIIREIRKRKCNLFGEKK